MGMLVDAAHGTVAVSYGVQDCLSWLAEVPMPPADVLEAVADADNPNSIQVTTPAPFQRGGNAERRIRQPAEGVERGAPKQSSRTMAPLL
jgi:hypothetical protein